MKIFLCVFYLYFINSKQKKKTDKFKKKVMLDFLNFCQFYSAQEQNHDKYSIYRLDLCQGKYSVVTKSLEESFSLFFSNQKKNHFQDVYHEETIGKLLYLTFTDMLYRFIQDHANEIENVVEEFPIDTKDNSLVDLFFNSSFPDKKNPSSRIMNHFNLLENVEHVRNLRVEEQIMKEMNRSLFFTFLFSKDKQIKRNEFRDIPFQEVIRLLLRFIFACELYEIIENDLTVCHSMYGTRFFLEVQTIFYQQIEKENKTLCDFIMDLEAFFLKTCESGIFNIEYSFDTSIYNHNSHLWIHLDPRYVRDEINSIDPDSKRKNHKKVFHYEFMMKDDRDCWSKCNIFQDWIIDLVVELIRNQNLENVYIKSVIYIFRAFYTSTTMRYFFVQYHEKVLTNTIKNCVTRRNPEDKNICPRNNFPKYFRSFCIKDNNVYNHEIKNKLLQYFPMKEFNYHTSNSNLWYLINIIELYRYQRIRNYKRLESFIPKRVKFFSKLSNSVQQDRNRIGYTIHLLKKTLISEKQTVENSFLDCFLVLFSIFFRKFFEKNLRMKLLHFDIRIELIQNRFQWPCNSWKKDVLYNYFCRQEKDLFPRILEGTIQEMKEYLVPGYEIFTERVKQTIRHGESLFCQQSDMNIASFVIEFICGVQVPKECRTTNEMIKILIQNYVRLESSMIYNMSIDSDLFQRHSELTTILLDKFDAFVFFIKKMEQVYFPINEQKHEIEKVITLRITSFLQKNMYDIMVS